MSVEKLRLEVSLPELCFGQLAVLLEAVRRRNKQWENLFGNVLIVCLGYHRVFVEYVMHKLRRDNNFDLAIHSLRAWIDQLTRFTLFLSFGRCLRKK